MKTVKVSLHEDVYTILENKAKSLGDMKISDYIKIIANMKAREIKEKNTLI